MNNLDAAILTAWNTHFQEYNHHQHVFSEYCWVVTDDEEYNPIYVALVKGRE
mgnify:FL=1